MGKVEITYVLVKAGTGFPFSFGVRSWMEMGVKAIHMLNIVITLRFKRVEKIFYLVEWNGTKLLISSC